MDPGSGLHGFAPNAVLFALDARHLLAGIEPGGDPNDDGRRIAGLVDDLAAQWSRARQAFRCQVIQQTLLPVFPTLFGGNEHRLPGSPYWAVQQFNAELRRRADAEGVDLLALDAWIATDGLAGWHDPALWHRAKQEIHPSAAPVYGDLVAGCWRPLWAGRRRHWCWISTTPCGAG